MKSWKWLAVILPLILVMVAVAGCQFSTGTTYTYGGVCSKNGYSGLYGTDGVCHYCTSGTVSTSCNTSTAGVCCKGLATPVPTTGPLCQVTVATNEVSSEKQYEAGTIEVGSTITLSWSADDSVSALIFTENQFQRWVTRGLNEVLPMASASGSSGTVRYTVVNTDNFYFVLGGNGQTIKFYSVTASWQGSCHPMDVTYFFGGECDTVDANGVSHHGLIGNSGACIYCLSTLGVPYTGQCPFQVTPTDGIYCCYNSSFGAMCDTVDANGVSHRGRIGNSGACMYCLSSSGVPSTGQCPEEYVQVTPGDGIYCCDSGLENYEWWDLPFGGLNTNTNTGGAGIITSPSLGGDLLNDKWY